LKEGLPRPNKEDDLGLISRDGDDEYDGAEADIHDIAGTGASYRPKVYSIFLSALASALTMLLSSLSPSNEV